MCKTNTRKRIAFLVAVLLAVAIFAAPAEASGAPSKIIVFTDKKVYQAWWVDSPQSGAGVDFVGYDPDFGDVYVYATVLDVDGKIMKGRTITGNLYDTVEYDHEQKANPNVHHANLTDPNLYDRSLIFNDTGTFGDGVAGDGIYTAKTTLSSSSLGLAAGNARNENHIKLRAYANDTAGGLSGNTEALISSLLCMNGFSGNMGGTHAKWTPGGMDNCAVCHIGYEHFYENKSGTFADSQLDIHALKWNPADVTPTDTCGKGFEAWVWNRSGPWDAGGASCTENWETQVPGSKYCFRCHIDGSALYDYDSSQSTGATTRNNLGDKPSCNNANCHSSTDIEGAAVIPWTQAGAVSGAGQSNSNIWKQKSHNHSTTLQANVSCALCHLTQHGFTRPGNSTTNMTQICLTCHNRSDGWINVSKNVSHTSTNACKSCHVENNKLDSHLVTVGVFGGRWCMDCHKINGKSPIAIDENVTNVSNTNYIHYELNNKSAGTTNSSRICWGCHTNNSVVVNGIVNSTMLPASTHPDKYDQPRNCTSCHNSTASTNFSAPQTYRHTWYAANMKTSAVTYCTNCHGQSEMALSYNQSATTPSTSNESTSHYGKVRTDLEEKIGTREYCGYCHQNETTVMGPFANADNEVRSDHASQATTPGCGNNTCHKPGRMHENTLVVPTFTEANIGTTCQACHSSSSYSSHNSTVTCWDCHMGNVSSTSATWIHPIQFIQYNGNFTGAKLTGATCYDCHKSISVDSTITNLSGKAPPKVYNQAHSNDPSNGTKWGDYWKYTPTTYEFASYDILGGNGSIDSAHPFANIQVPSNDYMQLNETQIGRNFEAIFPGAQVDREFTASQGNWTGAVVVGATISGSYDSATGNSAGSLKVTDSASTAGNQYSWTSPGFYYNGTAAAGYKYANFSMDRKRAQNDGTTLTNVLLVRPLSGKVEIYNSTAQTGTDASFTNLNASDISSSLTENGTYKIIINTTYVKSGADGPSTTYYDNVKIMVKEKVWNRYEIIINTTGVPINGSSKLGMSYQVHRENTSLKIYNKTSKAYELLDTLDKGVFYDYTKNISTHHINSTNGVTGNVSVKFVDDDQSDTDATTDAMHIRYLYIYTDRGLQYPCEQCHSPNKHYINPTIGSPDKFKANNAYDQAISSTGTWCQQCHWQGAANYSKMIQEFNVTRNPPENIPPEITGNASYGNYTQYGGKSKDGSTDYYNHSSLAMDDASCFSCHGAAGDTTTSQFVHNVRIGTSGGRNCTSCHDVNGDKKKVNFTSVNKSMHGKLNSGASSTAQNASNKPCWGCHGTRNGTWANESDQPLDNHNTSVYKAPRKCADCHITGSLQFTNKNVTDHIPSGYTSSTDVNTSSYSYAYCANCHNNSIGASSDPDGLGLSTGGSAMNASVSHYGANKTANKLMNATSNSTDCVYCHRNSSNTQWGILQGSLANISNKNTSGGGTDHGTYTSSSSCGQCHGSYSAGAGFTFHNASLGNGSGGGSGPNCKSCHDIGGSQTGKLVNFSAMNDTNAIHKNLNSGAVTALDAGNKKCWACHGDGSEPSAHPSNYKTPYNCTDCHNASGTQSGKYPGWNVTEHVKAGTVSGTELFTPLAANCYACHNKTEMMIAANDPDSGTGAIYGGANGGNNSTSHYGLKRNLGSGDTYCNYCHSNASSIFYLSGHNKSIFEHTANTSADVKNTTTLTCANSICHSSGRIHNASLAKPVQINWTQGQKDYCAPCHNSTGSANKKVYNQRHNPANSSGDNITNCNYCHDSGSLGNTTLSYNLNVHSDNLTYPTNAINCTACHNASSTYVKSRKILTHFPNASKDKGNTSLSARTCEACHGITAQSMHASGLVKKPAYTCADCHVSTAAGPYWANQSFNSYIDITSHDNASTANATNCVWCHNNTNRVEPFHFTSYANGSAANPGWGGWQAGNLVNCTNCHDSSYSNQAPFYAPAKPHAGTGNNTDECYSCHTSVNTYAAAPLAVHTVIQAPGNANCTKCHDMGGAASKEVDVASMNKTNSIHVNLNSGAANSNATAPYATDSKRCWACHGDGSDKNEHNQARYKAPYKCEDCHTSGGSQSGKYPSFNVTEHFASGGEIKTANAGYCYTCHNKGEMLQGHNDTDVLSSNASVGHYGKKRGTEMRSGANTTCTYCHQNSTTAFESAMLRSSNKSILEHTDSGTRNTTGRACTDSACHSQGFIHNATLTKPSVQVWTSGKQDYCAPCHKAGNTNATKYVYGHNSSNITVISTDCGYCHNSSSQGQISTGGLKLHASTLTNKSATNSTCVSCHRDDAYVTSQRAINTHYPGAPQGKANTSLDSFTCEACHGNMALNKMHSPVSIPSDRCNNCHNGTASGTYKATKIPYVNSTKHDNASHNVSNNINCNWCHNNTNAIQKFHFTQYPNGSVQAPGWSGWVNGTNANCTNCHDTYNQTKPFYAEPVWHKGSYGTTPDNCYQCHTNVSSSTGSFAPIALHNVTKVIDWSYCNNCHSNNYGGAPVVDNSSLASSMHFSLNGSTPSNTEPACKACHGGNATTHRNASANNCTYCHITGSTKYSAKNVSRHIPYPLTINVNTSRYQNVFCSDCHNNSLRTFSDSTPGSGNATTSHYGMNKTANKLMSATNNSTDCVYCHRNNSNMQAWGILSTGNANLSNKGGNHLTAINSECYTCHVNSSTTPVNFHVEDLNAGAGGGPDCKACHDIGGNAQGKLVNFSAMNAADAIHRNLNSGASDTTSSAENRKCWACHTRNGTQPQAGNHSFVDRYKTPYNCTDCHISKAGQNFNYTPKAVLNVTQHKADTLNGTTIFTPLAQDCYACHNRSEMMIAANDPDLGTGAVYGGLHGGNDSASHYGLKRDNLGGYSQNTDGYCNYCHSNASSPFYLSDANKSIIEHTTNTSANISNVSTLRCVDCHRTGRIHNASLNKTPQSAWTSGQKDFCAPCHKPKPTGQANKSVYLQGHDPVNSSSDRIGDCGFCHNASSQGANGSYLNVHSETLTNRSTAANSFTCQGCHNGTSIYTGSAKQVLSHIPNASQYRGNTSTSSYTCEKCHNMSNKPSMHSAGMNRSNGTCDSCHLNNTSPFRSLAKNLAQLAGMLNHSYNGTAKTNCTMCHNASGAAKGFHLDQYAAGIIADPERINSVWSNRNLYGFTDTPYVDCIDCHEKFNNTAPFNAPFFEANKTGVNNQEHVGKGYIMTNCYVCHTYEDDVSKRVTLHNVSIEPLTGGPNCTKCHNIGATASGKAPGNLLVNFTAFNSTGSKHRNLTNATAWGGSTVFGLIDTACWACHQSDGKQMERHPDLQDNATGYRAYRCADCHTVGGIVSSKQPKIYQNATKVYKHYPGAVFSGSKVFPSAINCSMCHKNSKVADINLSGYSENIDAMATNISHYATRTDLIDTRNKTGTEYGCNQCHGGGAGGGGGSGQDYGNARNISNNHNTMGVSPASCQKSCHNSVPSFNITLHSANMGINIGTSGCYSSGCHTAPSSGGRRKR